MVKKFNIWLYVVGTIVVVAMIVYLYILFAQKENEIKQSMISHKLQSIKIQKSRLSNWINKMCKNDESIHECIVHNPDKSKILNDLLSIIVNQDIRYAFLVYKDEKQRYRFIGDGASDPANVMQKIDPDNKKTWDEVYDLGKEYTISEYAQSDGLWLTHLSPFIKNSKTYVMLVTDFSISLDENIKNTILPIKHILFYILSITLLIFIIGIIQTIMYLYAKKESFTDQLTGLYNRNYLRKIIEGNIPYQNYIVAMADVDFFKKINDMYGHDIGDIVLKDISNIFNKMTTKNNLIFRYGGEEFLLLIEKQGSKDFLIDLISQIRHHEVKIENKIIKFTISIGVNQDLHRYKNFTDMIKSADIALYNAKTNGRDQIIYYSEEIQNEEKSNFQVIQAALDEDRVFCEFQAIMNTSTNKVFKYEVLVRIKSSDGKTLYPNSFLDVISNTNIYTDLTKKVIDIAIKNFTNENIHHFSINLGLQDFNNKEIINYIIESIEKYPTLLELMTIEVLEHDKVDYEQTCINVIKLLQNRGLKIALDDFGSGYANFSTILSYRFDFIKIDGAIIEKVIENDKAINIIQSIVDFSKVHDIIVICEFVSSKEIYEILKSIGVEYMQGYYLSKPSKDIY